MIKTKSVIRVSMVLMAAFLMLFALYACEAPNQDNGSNINNADTSDVFGDGPYATTQEMRSGPNGSSGVFYPRNIASETGTFPVFVFGCGAGTGPNAYRDHGNNIASHGFIVIINASDNQGRMQRDSIDWIIAENDNSRSVFYGRVNTDKIAAGGHSLGSVGTFNMDGNGGVGCGNSNSYHELVTTTVHVAGGSFSGTGPSNLKNPTIYISGTGDMALSNCQRDYTNTPNRIPVFFTVLQGVDHIYAAREGLPFINAWLKWHLQGQTQYKAEFLEPGGLFTTTPRKWESQSKNW